jgi:ribonuclease P protein component
MLHAGAYLRRADRLRSPRDFRRVGVEGARAASANFVVLSSPRREPGEGPRLGITVTRRVGNAVVRNQLKRRVRETFRRRRDEFRYPVDVVVIARRGAVHLTAADLESEIGALFRSCAR